MILCLDYLGKICSDPGSVNGEIAWNLIEIVVKCFEGEDVILG